MASSTQPSLSTSNAEPALSGSWRARVIINAPVGLLDYALPDTLVGHVSPGSPVRVPLGKRRTSAYVVELTQAPLTGDFVLRPLDGIDEERPQLPIGIISLVIFAAAYYGVAPGEMLQAALPAMARPSTTRFCMTEAGKAVLADAKPDETRARGQASQIRALQVASRFAKGFSVAALERELGISRAQGLARLNKLSAAGLVDKVAQKAARAKMRTVYTRLLEDSQLTLPPRQRAAMALLSTMPVGEAVPLAELVAKDAGAAARLRRLAELGIVEKGSVAERTGVAGVSAEESQDASDAGPETEVLPTDDQAAMLAQLTSAIDAQAYAPFLLHGVTGSGKTEVYLRAIAHVLAFGQTALVLVPEIALTPQLGARFRARFGERVATFHSGLSVAERRDEWERVAQGRAQIGLGARSALFLPLANLGIVIVDEEHETSFKQDESPRYNARDLALWRAREQNAVIILGSATPSLESFHNTTTGRYTKLSLPGRVGNRPMPPVDVIDLTHAEKANDTALSLPLAEAMERTFLRGEQAILFLNRRGFAPYVFCRDCGHSYRCDDCDVALTLHRRKNCLLCHYCGITAPIPDTCAGCQGDQVGEFGMGTERLETEVRSLFENLTVARLDRDTVQKKADLDRVLRAFRRGETQLLIGTQMVAKGHDFANVTLVGVMAADASLNFPDFRAAERTFQLLTQVAGRAGRGERPGRVLVQAYETNHYAIETARTHDYQAFVDHEMQAREELNYPPYTFLAQVRFESEREAETMRCAQEQVGLWRARLIDAGVGATILGPAVAPLSRLRGQWRVQALLKADTRQALRAAVRLLPARPHPAIRRILDVDPVSML